MKSKLILRLALVLSGGLISCSTTNHSVTVDQITALPLYVHFGFDDGNSARRFLSAQIHLEEPFFVGGDDHLELKGHVKGRDINLVADLMGSTGQQGQFYRGNVTLEKPVFAQGGAASGGAGPPCWFVISTNSDSRAIVERVNAGLGFTNTSVNRPAAVLDFPPAVTNFPGLIDPATGLPMSLKQEKQR